MIINILLQYVDFIAKLIIRCYGRFQSFEKKFETNPSSKILNFC